MIDDFLKTIRSILYERIASPLFTTALLSWLGWNYRLVAVLASDTQVLEKFRIIDEVLYPADTLRLHLYWGPAVTTVFFLFAYPFIAKPVYAFWRARQKELLEIRRKIDDETPLTIEQSRAIRREIIELRESYQKEISSRDMQIQDLRKGQAPEFGNTPQETVRRHNQQKLSAVTDPEVSEEALMMLKAISAFELDGKPANEEQLFKTSPLDRVQTKYWLDELTHRSCANRVYESGKYVWRLMHKGREILLSIPDGT